MEEEIWNEIYRLGERMRILIALKEHYRFEPGQQKKISKKLGDLTTKADRLLAQLS